MTSLSVSLFQSLRVSTEQGQSLDIGSPTTRSLFAFLILNRAQAVDRQFLAFCFWPQVSEAVARRNLRQYLHRIKRALEPVNPESSLLVTNNNHVQFNPQSSIWLDVDKFRQLSHPNASLTELQEAATLYRGDLLEDIYEDWCQEERQNLRQSYVDVLTRLSHGYQIDGNLNAAIKHTQKWISVEPYDEAGHQQLMVLLTLDGKRHHAIKHFYSLKELLANELDTVPLPETDKLIQAIQSGNLLEITQAPSSTESLPLNHSPTIQADEKTLRSSKAEILIPMIGRREELARLQSFYSQAEKGQGLFVLVTGESGVGKTRLIQEFQSHLPDAPTLKSTCHELEAMLPFAPLRQIVQHALDILPESSLQPPPAWFTTILPLAPSLSSRFTPLLNAEAIPVQSSHLTSALLNLFQFLSANLGDQPLLVILDDLQWADTQTWNVLAQLSQRAQNNRILMIGMCRLEDLHLERTRLIRTLTRNSLISSIPLARLTTEETADLAASLLRAKNLDPHFLNRVYQETEGNPFFIIEIVRAITESGKPAGLALESGGALTAPGLPLSIQRAIEARLDYLSPTSQELLATAAAIGRTFTLILLGEISQKSAQETIPHIEEWLQRGFIIEDVSGYDFSHEKIRQVTYSKLSQARRQYIHRRIADVLEHAIPPADAPTLAYHYARSDQPLKALPHLTQAGEQALRERSYLEARQFGLKAVSLLSRVPGPRQNSERVDLNLQLAQAYAFSGDLSRAQEILIATEPLANSISDDARRVRLFYRSAQIFWLRGQPELAGDYARRALRVAEELNETHLLQAALRMLGRVSIALSSYDDAIAYLTRYINLEQGTSNPNYLPVILGYLGVAYNRVGSWKRALQVAQRGVDLAKQAQTDSDANTQPETVFMTQALDFARMQLAFIYADHRDWQNCSLLLQIISESSANPPPYYWDTKEPENGNDLTPLGFMLLGLRGRTLAHLGRPDEGAKMILRALDWAERSDYRVFHYLPRIFLAETLLIKTDYVSAQVEIEKSLEQARAAGNRWAVGVSLRLLAEILSRQTDPNWTFVENNLIESMDILRQVRALPDLARTYLALRRLYDRAGQIAWAVDCHFRAVSIFEQLEMVNELRQAQGQAAYDRRGSVVIPGLTLRGPNTKGINTEASP